MGDVDELVKLLVAGEDDAAQHAAIGMLSDLAADAYGPDAVNLAAKIRDAGGIATLVKCAAVPDPDVQQCALSLLVSPSRCRRRCGFVAPHLTRDHAARRRRPPRRRRSCLSRAEPS